MTQDSSKQEPKDWLTMCASFLKRHHIWHTWTRWEPMVYTIRYEMGGVRFPEQDYKITYMDRRCQVCGKLQSERV
jgi:hypothetical protein